MQARFEVEEREKAIQLLEKDRARQQAELASQSNLRRGLMGGFGLLLAVLALLFNRYRLKSREAHMRDAVERERAANERLRRSTRSKTSSWPIPPTSCAPRFTASPASPSR